jgi:hypothetical protein
MELSFELSLLQIFKFYITYLKNSFLNQNNYITKINKSY